MTSSLCVLDLMREFRIYLLLGALLLIAADRLTYCQAIAAEATEPAVAAESKPNFLIIVADDLGYSDLGCFGGEIETPELDALAERGVRLTRFYNAGRCCPSRAAILTGQYPHRVGLGHMVQDLGLPGYAGRLPDEALTIAQVLASARYRSLIAGKWHLGGDDPTRHGFEEFYGTLVSAKTFWDPDHFIRLPADRRRRAYAADEFYATSAVTDHALEFLDRARQTPDRPWFLYLAYNAPHFPLHAPKEDIAKYADRYHVGWDAIRKERLARMKEMGIVASDTPLSPRSRYWDWGESEPRVNPPWGDLPADRRADLARRMAIYAAMVDSMDRNIGRVVDNLRPAGELDNTLIVFLSDNGACAEWDPRGFDVRSSPNNILHAGEALEQMGSPGTFHSVGSGWANASNTPWRLYKHHNHEGGVASPCIVHWPRGLDGGGRIVDAPTHIIDLMPTLVELSSANHPRAEALPGRSLMPLLTGEAAMPRTLFFEHEGHRAVIDGKWKLVALRGQPWEMYDILHDRTEVEDLAVEHADVVQRLSRAWDRWARENHVLPAPDDYQVGYLPPGSDGYVQVGRWDTFEHSFTKRLELQSGFPEVELMVTYTRPDRGTVRLGGFYRGDGRWSLRCMPDQLGTWRYESRFSNGLDGPSGSFRCVPSDFPGMISRDESNSMWFGYEGGQHELIRGLHIGDRFFANRGNTETGEPWSAERRTAFLDWAQAQGYNTLSIASHLLRRNEGGRGNGWNSPDLWDESAGRPRPAEFDRMEEVLNDLKQRKMVVYPFAGMFGRSSDFPTDPAQQEVYLKYVIARLAPYWNVMFMVGGPEPHLRGKPYLTTDEIHRLGRRIAELDPFDHLLSVHNPTGDDKFKDADWVTYGTLQGPKTLNRQRLYEGLLRNHHSEKPLLAQETLWSGNVNHIRATDGGYGDDHLRKNAYVMNMVAVAIIFADNDGNSSSGFSGSMDPEDRRQERHDIIKRIWDFFEGVPIYRMKPRSDVITDADGANVFCLAEPGRQYLFYVDAPGSVSADIEEGSYHAQWINAQNTSQRHSIGQIRRVHDMQTPDGGDDWLLWLTAPPVDPE